MLTIEQLAKEMKPELAEQEARLDIRLSALYKTFLKQVYRPAGYRSLSAFIIQAAIDKAEALIAKESVILATERDRQIFFTALLDSQKPNDALVKATKSFKEATTE